MASYLLSRALVTALLLLATTDFAHAWTPLGLDGGTVHVIAVDPTTPTTLYAAVFAGPNGGDGRGIYKSTNGGATWNAANTGLVLRHVEHILVHPQNTATVYVATSDGGIARSTNGAASWTQIGGGAPYGPCTGFVIDPISPSKLYAASNGGVFKSVNSGGSFTASNSGLTTLVVRALAIDPVNPAVLYVSTFDGVFKSSDGAATWAPSNTGLPAAAPDVIVVDPATPSTVYAAGCAFGTFRSVDGGATWTANATGLPNATPCVRALAANPAAPGTVYLAATDDASQTVFESTDAGATWSASSGGLEGHVIEGFAFDPGAPATVYAGAQAGFFKSTNGGGIWTLGMSGIRHTYVQTLAVDPNAPATLYAGGGSDGPGSVSKSVDGGASWVQIGPRSHAPADNAALSDLNISQIAIDPTNSARVYLGSGYGVFRSSDGGTTWAWGATQNFGSVFSVAVDPLAPAVLYAATYGQGLQKSTDSGATWTVMNAGLPSLYGLSVVTDPQHAGTLYVSVPFQGVFKSVDGAASWAAVNNGFQSSFVSNLAMDPTNSDILYVTASGLYRTGNGGASWTEMSSSGGGFSLIIDPVAPTTLYAVADTVQVDKSSDAGATWTGISPAGLVGVVNGIAIDPATGDTLYAATLDGVFKSGTATSICSSAADCNDGDLCTTDICDPGGPGTDPGTGCRSEPVVCDQQCHATQGFCDDNTGECVYSSSAFPDGTPCDDGDLCTFDRCLDGTCVGNPTPEPSCHEAGSTRFSMRRGATSARDVLVWKWNKGGTFFDDFGNPSVATRYALCVYDRSGLGGASAAMISAAVPFGVLDCGGKPCWQRTPTGFKYKDRLGSGAGVTDIRLRSGRIPDAKILAKARGAQLGVPLPLTPNVTVQLRKSDDSGADCWGADYQGIEIRRNDNERFKAATY